MSPRKVSPPGPSSPGGGPSASARTRAGRAAVVLGEDGCAVGPRKRPPPPLLQHVGAEPEHRLRRPLDGERPGPAPVQCRHPGTAGNALDRVDARASAPQRLHVHAEVEREGEERALGVGRPLHRAVDQDGIVVERGEARKRQEGSPVTEGHRLRPRGGGGHGHAVLRDGAGLVEAHGLEGTEALDRAHLPDQDAAPFHPAQAPGERRGGDHRQPLRHGRDRERHRVLQERREPVPPQEAEPDEERAGREAREGETAPEPVELDLERRLRPSGACREQLDPPRLRRGPGSNDEASAPALGDDRPGVEHAAGINGYRGLIAGPLGDGQAFARERGFVDPEPLGIEKPRIGRDLRARLDEDDVARHKATCGDANGDAPAQSADARRAAVDQRVDRTFRLALGDEAEHAVEGNDGGGRQRVGDASRRQGDRGRAGQHRHGKAAELLRKQFGRTRSPLPRQDVRAMLEEKASRLVLGKTPLGIGVAAACSAGPVLTPVTLPVPT
jgi:hypothetical protein